ncbi:MAG: MarR family transcriptional regulator [Candidimonas sp.]|nr:MAG: MarR family transcriptional regulator [Candidimonas sp.]TAM21704.1 MAG: MarR family transcriptional regulator [Candidimonas sp.]TAM77654.1 MAG: MarR family transcriptional regulator [Candidimonas sp.]
MPDDDFPQIKVLQKLGRTYRALLTAFDANIGQPMPRWRVLLMLHQQGETSQKKLAQALRMDPASLTRQIKTIERLGWVERHRDVRDNRLTNVVLSKAGVAVVEQTLPRRMAFIQRALTDLSLNDLATLSTMLDRLDERLRDETCRALHRKT